jgi:transmembrane sensor
MQVTTVAKGRLDMADIDEAARWFAAQRRGVMSLDEQAAREAWLSSRENRKALSVIEGLWSALETAPKPAMLPPMSRKLLLAAICVSCLVLGLASSITGGEFWSGLDWINR